MFVGLGKGLSDYPATRPVKILTEALCFTSERGIQFQ